MKHGKTFGEYCESELGLRVVVPVNQLDLVFDLYRQDSLNAETRKVEGVLFVFL